MKLKKTNPKLVMRTKLSKTLLGMNLSLSTSKKVSEMLKGMTDEQAEEKASQILTILASCKNESDVLTKLSIQ